MEDPLLATIGALIGIGMIFWLLGWLLNGLTVVLTVTLGLLSLVWSAIKRLWKSA